MKNEDIKGIDVKKGLSIVAGNKAVYTRLLKSFVNNAFCDQLLEAVNGGDPEQIRQTAHSLKGVAANMHMDVLFELSREIEAEAKSGVIVAPMSENVLRISEANAQTLESVNMLLADPGILNNIE